MVSALSLTSKTLEARSRPNYETSFHLISFFFSYLLHSKIPHEERIILAKASRIS